MKSLAIKFFVCLLLAIGLSGCVIIREMIPQLPSPSVLPEELNIYEKNLMVSDDDIITVNRFIDGFDEPNTPPNVEPTPRLASFLSERYNSHNLNRSMVFIVRTKTSQVKKRIILVPGIFAGAGTLYNLAKGIVRRERSTEVWIWERRSNLLEDRSSIQNAIAQNDPSSLYKMIDLQNGKLTPDAFHRHSLEDISFVGHWGASVMLGDLHKVVENARSEGIELILAGYSLGALYTTTFLASTFDTDKGKIAGHSLVDRVFLIDGPPLIEAYIKDENTYLNGAVIFPNNIIDGYNKLTSGSVFPCNGAGDKDMGVFFKNELNSALAFLEPDGTYPLLYINKFPISNMANFFINSDDNYNGFKLFTGTFGRADAVHSGVFSARTTVQVTGLKPGTKMIGWISRSTDNCTEFNDPLEYLRTNLQPDFNMPEWYQPTRIMLDFGAINKNDTSKGWQSKYFRITENSKVDKPIFCIGLSRGLSSRIENYKKYADSISSNDFEIIMIDKFTHIDGDTVSDNTSRQIIADVIANKLYGNQIIDKSAKNYDRACVFNPDNAQK